MNMNTENQTAARVVLNARPLPAECCFVVIELSVAYPYAFGRTTDQAIHNLSKITGQSKAPVLLYVVNGDDSPRVDSFGIIRGIQTAELTPIARFESIQQALVASVGVIRGAEIFNR